MPLKRMVITIQWHALILAWVHKVWHGYHGILMVQGLILNLHNRLMFSLKVIIALLVWWNIRALPYQRWIALLWWYPRYVWAHKRSYATRSRLKSALAWLRREPAALLRDWPAQATAFCLKKIVVQGIRECVWLDGLAAVSDARQIAANTRHPAHFPEPVFVVEWPAYNICYTTAQIDIFLPYFKL